MRIIIQHFYESIHSQKCFIFHTVKRKIFFPVTVFRMLEKNNSDTVKIVSSSFRFDL